MKPILVLLVLLSALPAVAQQPPLPNPQARQQPQMPPRPSLKFCQEAKAGLDKLGADFRSLSADDLQANAMTMILCATEVGPKEREDYGKWGLKMHEMLGIRVTEFVTKTGRWEEFVEWDKNPDNRF